MENAYIVKDDIEYGMRNVIPLWTFGFYIEIICIFVRCELKQIEIWVARFTLLVYRILRNSVEVVIFILIKRH